MLQIHECINYIEVVVQYAILPPDCLETVLLYICTVRHDVPNSQSLYNVSIGWQSDKIGNSQSIECFRFYRIREGLQGHVLVQC